MNTLPRFKHREVNDLCWALYSRAWLFTLSNTGHTTILTGGLGCADRAEDFTILQEIDDDIDSLRSFLQQNKSWPLGFYFECLIHYWIEYHPQYDLTLHGYRIMKGKSMMGELDFVYWCKRRKQHVHLELAVKFYLGYQKPLEWDHWLGPNPKDKFSIKIPKMLYRQSTRAKGKYVQKLLKQEGIDSTVSEMLLKGRLYSPIEDWAKQQLWWPKDTVHDMDVGWWGSCDKVLKWALQYDYDYYVLERKDWLSEIGEGERTGAYDAQGAIAYLKQHMDKNPVQLTVCKKGVGEISRGFVVPDTWP